MTAPPLAGSSSFSLKHMRHHSYHGGVGKVMEILATDPSDGILKVGLTGALDSSRIETLQLLLSHGAQFNPHMKQYKITCCVGVNIWQELINHGWDIRSSEEAPVLSLLIEDEQRLKWMLERGADPDTGYLTAPKALHCAAHSQIEPTLNILFHNGAQPDPTALYSCLTQYGPVNENVLRTLLDWGVDPNASYHTWTSVLHFAAHHGKEDAVRILLDGGADPSMKDKNGRSAEDEARISGHLGVVDYVLKFRSTLESEEANGMGPSNELQTLA
ncbi:Ankyrin-3 [Dactylella cylindrospora]|nr:Ankyrin-3 [Dactylella cylindrospora]